MSVLSNAAEDYLGLRRSLGHDLAEAHRLLPGFVAFLDERDAATVTIQLALDWAQDHDVDPSTSMAPRRMTIARGFARHMASLDTDTEVPPHGLIPSRQRWRPPFIYTTADIAALVAQARSINRELSAATHETVLGLLAATGMRIGEAISLDRSDIDWTNKMLLIRESKFGKTRYVPVLDSTLAALDRYATVRSAQPSTTSNSFFISRRGTRPIYRVFQEVFRRLCDQAEIGAGALMPPRIHDLRHTFAVNTLLGWYRNGDDVEQRLPALSTYLGHRDPRSTYWYLSAAPELLALAAERLEWSPEVISR